MNNTEFKKLRKALEKEQKANYKKSVDFIKYGYKDGAHNDNGLRYWLTDLRYTQYIEKKITRAQAVEYAIKRYEKSHEKEVAQALEKIAAIENSINIDFISISVEWHKSSVWGYNPSVEVRTNNGIFYGSASGCGYDKESSAIATALNSDYSCKKILYLMKNKGMTKDKQESRNILGYGSGYGVLPYFEGGVGFGCFESILKKAGFKCSQNHGKMYDSYYFYK